MRISKYARLFSFVFAALLVAGFVFTGSVRGQEKMWWEKPAPATAGDPAATVMVREAVEAMASHAWHVEGQLDSSVLILATRKMEMVGSGGTVSGVVAGEYYDWDQRAPQGDSRWISSGGGLWESTDRGRTWAKRDSQAEKSRFGDMPGMPLAEWPGYRQFTEVGRESHEDGTWVHLHSDQRGGPIPSEGEPLDCWILLDGNGKPAAVRRVVRLDEGIGIFAGRTMVYEFTVNFTQASAGEKIGAFVKGQASAGWWLLGVAAVCGAAGALGIKAMSRARRSRLRGRQAV